MIREFFFFTSVILLTACSSDPQQTESTATVTDTIKVEEPVESTDQFVISYPEFTVIINGFSAYFTADENTEGEPEPRQDTTEVEIELGTDLQGKTITFSQSEAIINSVEFRFLNSVSLSFEGPHLDLTGWKHYTSEWKMLKEISENEFYVDTVSYEETHQFPDVSDEEFTSYLRENSSIYEHMADKDEIAKISSLKDPHCVVTVSHYHVRINYTIANKQKVKLMIFHVPMGC
jgi:hypothetical protein